jgi:pimeloyl-ACP methyl ester carboxylesterase
MTQRPCSAFTCPTWDLAPYTGPGSRPLSAAERAYLAQYQRWREEDRGYGAIQSTRPQTVSYALNDSPAGLAAWVLEKWRGWADSGGDIDATAVAVFGHQFIDDGTPPREWAERLYNIRRWTPMPSGGHFPSAEEPDLLSRDIAAFFNDLSAAQR